MNWFGYTTYELLIWIYTVLPNL